MGKKRSSGRIGAITWDDFPRRKNANGEWLCRKCGTVLTGRRTAWCSRECLRAVIMMVDWRVIRRTILRRDKYTCTICGKRAAEVDHIIELADGGEWSNPSNLRSLCHSCHKKKTAAARKARAEKKKQNPQE